MSLMRLSLRTTVLRASVAMFASMIAVMASSLADFGSVRADDLPFWERADAVKAAAKPAGRRKVAYYASRKAAVTRRPVTQKKSAVSSGKKLGGYAERTEPVRHKRKGVKVAALGNVYYPEEKPRKSLSGGGVSWTASAGCLDPSLRAIIYQVAANYGSLRVNSTCRSRGHNRAVGGAPKSKHLSGDAVDFRVFGNVRAVYAYLRSNGSVGGLKHYGGGLFHIDNGDRRSW